MRLLLDTQAFLWFLLDDPRLSVAGRALIEDPANDVDVSPASYWEIAIKIGLKKYALPEPYQVFMERDPFDRLIISQAMVEMIPVVSADSQLDAYPITRLW